MKTSDFYYDLPHELIAQTPLKNRAKSRMLLLDKKTGEMEDKIFEDIVDYIKPGDTLVLTVELEKIRNHVGLGKAVATVDGKKACSAELTFMID